MDVEVVPATLRLKLIEDQPEGHIAAVHPCVQDPAAHAILGVQGTTALVNDSLLCFKAVGHTEEILSKFNLSLVVWIGTGCWSLFMLM